MYVHSRFRDLRAEMKHQYPGRSFKGLLVTNTRFTADAIKYAQCYGLKLKSWKYPEKDSLEGMIEEQKLYPITVMSGLTSSQLRKLFTQNIILMKYLAHMKTGEMIDKVDGGAALYSSPVADDSRVFIGNNDGSFLCVKHDGTPTS